MIRVLQSLLGAGPANPNPGVGLQSCGHSGVLGGHATQRNLPDARPAGGAVSTGETEVHLVMTERVTDEKNYQ